MVHNNFRKLLRRFCYKGPTTASSSVPTFNGIVDITGYIEENDTNKSLWQSLPKSRFDAYASNNVLVSNIFSGRIVSTTGQVEYYFLLLGNTIINEPDYTLGSFADSLLVTTSNSASGASVLFVSTLTNTSGTDVSCNELGLFYHYEASSTAASALWNGNQYMNMILIKEILTTPIIISAYSSVTLTMDMFGDVTIS